MAETQQEEKTEAQQQAEGQNAEFAEAVDNGTNEADENIDILLDINMPVTVNIGKTDVQFRRLLQLGPGSVLELDKTINQPVDLYVQDIKFANGDVVVVDGCFAVKIKEILGIDQAEQIAEKQQ
ncbi:MAG: FliM/FliN family flagellar motor switch protein [Planctomycetota bacterium]|jgi:flagellar motor switch protein FliN/FliY